MKMKFKLRCASKEATSATEFQSNRLSRGQKVEWEAHCDKKVPFEGCPTPLIGAKYSYLTYFTMTPFKI